MARGTMASLIARLRELVNDTGSATWTDNQLQTLLDRRRIRANYLQLNEEPTRSGSTISYLTFVAVDGDWEEDAALVSGTYASINADTADYENGRWAFVSEPARPVYLTGWTYDLYAAAADALEQQAATMTGLYDFAADGGSYKRSQQREGIAATAKQYRALQRVGVAEMYRGDVNVF